MYNLVLKRMEPEEFVAIYTEMNAVIAQMSPLENEYHTIKVGRQLIRFLNDYPWDFLYGGQVFNTDQVNAILAAKPTRSNMEFKIPMWLSQWERFDISSAQEREKKQFAAEVDAMRTALITTMADHPVSNRLQRWIMDRFDREQRTFDYDRLEKDIPARESKLEDQMQ